MDPKDILARIIDNKGGCDWVSEPGNHDACRSCPLSKLKKHADGNWMSCVEALQAFNIPDKEVSDRYLEIAVRTLLDIQAEELLSDSSPDQ